MTPRPGPAWALLFGGEAAVFGWLDYRDAMARHQWTGASIALGIGVLFALIAATLGYALGAWIARERARGRRGAELSLAAAGLFLMAWSAVRVARNRAREAQLDQLRTGPVTLDEARVLLRGPLDEVRALAYNPACPPQVLSELSRSDDWATRAAAAGNPSTPAADLDRLERDPNESVRFYLQHNPARKR